MAEIRVERKDYRPWLWLLLGISAVILGSCLVSWWRGDDYEPLSGSAPLGSAAGAAPRSGARIGDFVKYLENNRAAKAATLSHGYTADGLRRLAAAIRELSERHGATAAVSASQLDAVQALADSLQRNPRSTEHARYASEAVHTAASLMTALQRRHYPERRFPNVAAQVAQAAVVAELVIPQRRLLDQTADVRRFFDESAAVLRAMAGAGG